VQYRFELFDHFRIAFKNLFNDEFNVIVVNREFKAFVARFVVFGHRRV